MRKRGRALTAGALACLLLAWTALLAGEQQLTLESAALSATIETSPVQNGGFESGLTGWTAGGRLVPTASTQQAHSGTQSALLGGNHTPEPNGDSWISQNVAIPASGGPMLTFWYWPSTTDTIQYDWQEVQLRSTGGTFLRQVLKVCSNARTWINVTYDLSSYAGQTLQLWFNAHGDGYGDLTYIYLDDVDVTTSTPPPPVPDAPGSVTATAGNASAMVSWSAPADHGSGITKYTVTPYIGSNAQASTDVLGTPPATSANITGLTNGQTYTFKVTATNGNGTGPQSPASNPVIPATVPDAPTGVGAIAGDSSAIVSWTAPSANGSPISKYTVTPWNGSSALPSTDVSGNPPATSANITGLTNGTVYTFTVTATNGVGTGSPSAASSPVRPSPAPPPPPDAVQNGGFEVDLSGWTAGGVKAPIAVTTQSHTGSKSALLGASSEPEPSGDSTLSQVITVPSSNPVLTFWYRPSTTDTIQYDWQEAQIRNSSGGTLAQVFKVASNSQVWTKVTFDLSSYRGSQVVLWFNDHQDGYGDLTYMYLDDVSVGGSSAATPPAAPQSVTATAGNANAVVSWTAPADGGSGITKYTVTPFIGNNPQASTDVNGTPPQTTATINGLTNGQSYTFKVTATNAIGTGPAGTSNAVTPTGTVAVRRLSTDTFTNSSSQHQTQVEPDVFAFGSTIVSAFQSGRFTDGGSSDIGWASSADGGSTWSNGFLQGITNNAGGSFQRATDPSVVYNARYGLWMISSLAMNGTAGVAVVVSRSSGGATAWSSSISTVATGANLDKDWIVCDNTSSSPNYGRCYVEWDDVNAGDTIYMSTSTDGGATWGSAISPSGATGLGGQPLVQPGGRIVVPYWDGGSAIDFFTSTTGGASWSAASTIASMSTHGVGGGMRADPLPSAQIDGSGKIFVAWQDCRFENACAANGIVMATSTDGSSWSQVARIPTDAVGSGADHFIPGIGVDRGTSGATAHVGLTYYYLPDAGCAQAACSLRVGYVQSTDGGSTWSSPQELGVPMSVNWLATTNQGLMVGDYLATAFSGGKGFSVFAIAGAPSGSVFDEAMYTTQSGL